MVTTTRMRIIIEADVSPHVSRVSINRLALAMAQSAFNPAMPGATLVYVATEIADTQVCSQDGRTATAAIGGDWPNF